MPNRDDPQSNAAAFPAAKEGKTKPKPAPKSLEEQLFEKPKENAPVQPQLKKFKDMTPEEQKEFKERGEAEKLAKKLAKQAAGGGAVPGASGKQAATSQATGAKLASSGNTAAVKENHTPSAGSNTNVSNAGSNMGSNLNLAAPVPLSTTQSQANMRAPSQIRFDDVKHQKKNVKGRTLAQKPVPLLSHLNQFEKKSTAVRNSMVHPVIVSLGVQFSEFIISGGIARCLALLSAFKTVINDYVTPPGTSIQRNLTSYLGKQIDYLTTTRPMAETMKCAIRLLKSEISNVSLEKSDAEVKEELLDWIDMFIHERIRSADNAIVAHATEKIRSGDVILTFGRSAVVEQLLLDAHARGNLPFKVIVADARPKLEGRVLARSLAAAGIPCTYVLVNSLGSVMSKVTKLIVGASAVWANGAVLSRTGTAVVCMMARDAHVPVIVLCELIKFSNLVQLDSFVWNEIGDPDELISTKSKSPQSTLPSILAPPSLDDPFTKPPILKDWREVPDLKLLNLHYDVTPASFITLVICENGCIPSTSVLSVIQNMKLEEERNRKRID